MLMIDPLNPRLPAEMGGLKKAAVLQEFNQGPVTQKQIVARLVPVKEVPMRFMRGGNQGQ